MHLFKSNEKQSFQDIFPNTMKSNVSKAQRSPQKLQAGTVSLWQKGDEESLHGGATPKRDQAPAGDR